MEIKTNFKTKAEEGSFQYELTQDGVEFRSLKAPDRTSIRGWNGLETFSAKLLGLFLQMGSAGGIALASEPQSQNVQNKADATPARKNEGTPQITTDRGAQGVIEDFFYTLPKTTVTPPLLHPAIAAQTQAESSRQGTIDAMNLINDWKQTSASQEAQDREIAAQRAARAQINAATSQEVEQRELLVFEEMSRNNSDRFDERVNSLSRVEAIRRRLDSEWFANRDDIKQIENEVRRVGQRNEAQREKLRQELEKRQKEVQQMVIKAAAGGA